MKSVWGLDVGKSSFKAVRLQITEDDIKLTDFDIIEYNPSASRDETTVEQEFHLALNTFRSRHKMRGETIVVSPPFHSVFNRFVNLPAVSGDRLQEIVKYEAQQHIPFAIEEVIWSYQKTERAYKPGEEIEVVFFAVKRELIDQFVKLVNNSNLKIDIIQFAPVALYNYIMTDYIPFGTGRNFVILDVGANNTNLILVEGNKFWIRNLPIVGNDITKAIQQKLGISFAEAESLKVTTTSKDSPEAAKIFGAIQNVLKDLANEIHRSIGFYKSLASGRSVNFDRIILVGNASRTIYFEEFVSQRLQLATFRLSGLAKISLAENIDKTEFQNKLQGMGVALGLALQGLDRAPNKINLLPSEILQSRVVSRRRPFLIAIPVIIILVVLLLHLFARSKLAVLEQINTQVKGVSDRSDKITKDFGRVSILSEKIKQLDSLSAIGWQRDVWVKILNGINKLDVLKDGSLAPAKGFIERGNRADEQWVKEEEQYKIWLLEMKIQQKSVEEENPVPPGGITATPPVPLGGIKPANKEVINVELTCGMVARQQNDVPDLVASQEFIKEQLVKPLASEFGIIETSPVPLDNRPINELKTDSEIRESPSAPLEQQPKYYRFKVMLQVPIMSASYSGK